MKKNILFTLLSLIIFSNSSLPQEQLLSLRSNLPYIEKIERSAFPETDFEKKSPALAILYSVLLPGMGELYAGDYSTGKYFTIADGIIWSTFAGMTIYGNNKENDYRAFAKAYGRVDLNNKDDEYFANIGVYQNIEEFNREQELNRDFDEVYDLESDFWAWSSNEHRKEYRNLWTSSENAKNNVRFAVGALVLNRLISAIFAVRAVSAHNKREIVSNNWNLNFTSKRDFTPHNELIMNVNISF